VEKGLASGHVCGPDHAAEHIRFVTGNPIVTSLIFGSIMPKDIRANVRALRA
jgi:hypothetical protein